MLSLPGRRTQCLTVRVPDRLLVPGSDVTVARSRALDEVSYLSLSKLPCHAVLGCERVRQATVGSAHPGNFRFKPGVRKVLAAPDKLAPRRERCVHADAFTGEGLNEVSSDAIMDSADRTHRVTNTFTADNRTSRLEDLFVHLCFERIQPALELSGRSRVLVPEDSLSSPTEADMLKGIVPQVREPLVLLAMGNELASDPSGLPLDRSAWPKESLASFPGPIEFVLGFGEGFPCSPDGQLVLEVGRFL